MVHSDRADRRESHARRRASNARRYRDHRRERGPGRVNVNDRVIRPSYLFHADCVKGTIPKTGITNQTEEEPSVEPAIVWRATIARSISMGSTTDKIKGSTNEAIGKAKKGVGEAVGSDRLQGEGMVQGGKGHGQKAVGGAKQAAKDAANKAAAQVNKKL